MLVLVRVAAVVVVRGGVVLWVEVVVVEGATAGGALFVGGVVGWSGRRMRWGWWLVEVAKRDHKMFHGRCSV